MAGGLSPTTFSSGAKDAMATVDVYAKQSNTVVNSIQDIRSRFDVTRLDSMRGGDFTAAMGSVIRGVDAAGLIVDKSALIGRIVGSSSGLLGSFKELSGKAADSIMGCFEDKDGVFADIGGVISKVSSAAVSDVKALGSLIGDIVGDGYNFVVGDHDGITALYTGIINEATELGIPNSFGSLVKAIRDPNIINRIAGNIIPAIVGNGDVAGLLGVAGGTAMGVVKAINPKILSDFSRNYTYPLNRGVRDLQGQGNSIFRAYDAVDNGWDKASRLGDKIGNITNIQGASKDAKRVINSAAQNPAPDDGKDRSFYTLANVFEPTSVHDTLGKDFPDAAFSPAISAPQVTYTAAAAPKADSRLTDNELVLTGPVGYYKEKAKQDAYDKDGSLFSKVQNVFF